MRGRRREGKRWGIREGIAVAGEGRERRVFRMQEAVPRRRGRGREGGWMCGRRRVRRGGEEVVRWVDIWGNCSEGVSG